MKKKQLEQQNIALFAEVERKSNEITALTLHLKELMETYDVLLTEKQELNLNLSSLKQEYNALKEHNRQLAEALQDILLSSSKNPNDADSDHINSISEAELSTLSEEPEESSSNLTEEVLSESSTIYTESVLTQTDETPEPYEDIKPTYPPEPVAINEELHQPPLSQTDVDLLRAHGAELIGRLTRQTASLLSNLEKVGDTNSEAAKTLLLGKNESFKYKILTLLNASGSAEELQTEMDKLAEETAAYLTASCEGF